MGYSLAPGPDAKVPNFSRNSRVLAPSIPKGKPFEPREELAPIPSRGGEDVTEIVSFLNNVEPPKQPESRTNSKLKKSTFGTLWKIGRFSSKRQEQLRGSLPKRTRDEESIAGAKYLHIAVDQSAFKSSANLSMYRANDYRDPAQKRMTVSYSPTILSETPLSVERVSSTIETPTIPKSQSFNLSDALGISREYPHLVSGAPKTKAIRKPGHHGTNNVSSSDTLVPRHDNDDPKTKDFAIHSSNVRFEIIPADVPLGREVVASTGSATSSVLDLTAILPRTSSKTRRRTSNRQLRPISIEVVTQSPQVSPQLQRSPRSPRSTRVPSRQSVRSISSGLPTHTPRDSQSTRSSMQSANDSVADDILTDTSSGIVLNAQSAEYMRPQGGPGYYSSATMRKPSKPGPAPTRALPSLPEGHDGITMVHRTSTDTRNSTLRIEPSPERPLAMEFPSPPKSPPKKQRYSHYEVASNNQVKVNTLIKSATAPQPHWPLSSNPPFPPTAKRNSIQIRDPPSTIVINPETLAAWRRRRANATKARKRRDLDRGRVRRNSRNSVDKITVVDNSDGEMEDSKHTDTPSVARESYSSADDKGAPSDFPFSGLSTTSSYRRQDSDHQRQGSNVSPIMVVASQSPDTSPKRTSWLSVDAHQGSSAANSNSSVKDSPEMERKNRGHSIPPKSPSLPLSDEEGRERSHSRTSVKPKHARPKRPQTPIGPSLSPHMHQHNPRTQRVSWDPSELEARMEARLAAMERKNTLLEAALLAVIDASAGFGMGGVGGSRPVSGLGLRGNRNGGMSAGKRSSGVSTVRNSVCAESRLEALIGGL
ncbi:hypothetical protein MMC08_001770 [Hypocenomyce scalaris]|nr:hypothetical protein [Hypocenomyce scalaris]